MELEQVVLLRLAVEQEPNVLCWDFCYTYFMNTPDIHVVKVAIALKAVIKNKEGKILILQRPEGDYSRSLGWDLPGGGLNNAENPIDGITREIKEETNLDVKDVMPIDAKSFIENDGCSSVMIGFKALATTNIIKLSDEHIAYKWLSPEEILVSDIPETYKNFVNNYEY